MLYIRPLLLHHPLVFRCVFLSSQPVMKFYVLKRILNNETGYIWFRRMKLFLSRNLNIIFVCHAGFTSKDDMGRPFRV